MKKLLFVFAAMLMASSAFAGHNVVFNFSDFATTSGEGFTIEKDGVTITVSKGMITETEFIILPGGSLTFRSDDGILDIAITCTGQGDNEFGPANLSWQWDGSRGQFTNSGYTAYWEDGIWVDGEFISLEEDNFGEEFAWAPFYIVDFYASAECHCTKINVGALGNSVTPPVVDQVGAPTFVGYTEDGIYGYGVYIVPTTEGSNIKYRVFIEEDGQWVLVTDWTEYLGIPMEIWMNEADAKYRVEAYAYIGEVKSNTVAYEYQVEPWTSIDEMNASKAIAGVRYFNLAGQEMPEANGMTIVVTTYTDGTTSAAKVIK